MKFSLALALLLCIGSACVLAAPSLPTPRAPEELSTDDALEATDSPVTDATDSPLPTTMDPSKEARILSELTAGGRSLAEVKQVQALLAKSRARLERKHAERKAVRSEKQKAEEAAKYEELKQWEEKRRQLGQRARQGQKPMEKRPSIQKINSQAGLDSFLYQGDMEINAKQAAEMLDLDAADKLIARKGAAEVQQAVAELLPAGGKRGWNGARLKRQVVKPAFGTSFLTWPYGDIQYAYHSSVSASNKTLIRKAMDQWESGTCLAFYEDASATYTMVFNTATSGCNAPVGLTQGTKNYTVSVNANGCMQIGTIAHEIGHNVGMWHTMSRDDRDATVYVYEDNVDPAKLSNYNKTNAAYQQSFSIPYDMGSVMHYDRKAFSANGEQTITWSGPTWEWDQTMGSQNMGPGMQDFKLINSLYNCSQYCVGQSPVTCYNGGFTKPWGTGMCSTCVCPPGVGGSQCETPVSSAIAGGYAPAGVTNTCTGARLNATTSWQNLTGTIGSTTRAGQNNNDYANCHWWMQAPVGYHMVVEVTAINDNVFAQCTDGCFFGFTEVRMGNANSDWSLPGRRMCCPEDLAGQFGSSLTFTAPSNAGGREAMISTYVSLDRQSFKLRYKAVAN